MSIYKDVGQIQAAVLNVLMASNTVALAKRRIRLMPGPSTVRGGGGGLVANETFYAPRGMHFDIVSDIVVAFDPDGTRTARFEIAVEHDDPNPQDISVRHVPGLLVPGQAEPAGKVLSGTLRSPPR